MNVNDLRQRLETGIATIKSNWPPDQYTMLREALTLAVELMEQALLQQPPQELDEDDCRHWLAPQMAVMAMQDDDQQPQQAVPVLTDAQFASIVGAAHQYMLETARRRGWISNTLHPDTIDGMAGAVGDVLSDLGIVTRSAPELDDEGYRQEAISLIKQAAGLCASACGALMDCDEPDVRKYRPQLLRYRSKLNQMAYDLERSPTP